MQMIVNLITLLGITALTLTTNSTFTQDELLGVVEPTEHQDFTLVPESLASHSTHYLRTEVVEAFVKMAQDAKKEGIHLEVVSAFRSFHRQKTIWNTKFARFKGSDLQRAQKILEYSSMPGTSRHHWGTDFDLNSVNPAFFDTPQGIQIYIWLENNAHKYGFFQPYKEFHKHRPTGFREEKWHWSYAPLADKILKEYKLRVKYEDITGFVGSYLAEELNVIENYVLCIEDHNINPKEL